jgi:hypothetical protein
MSVIDGEPMAKSLDQQFADWEGFVFGFGYGTGEEHTLPALKRFFAAIGRDAEGLSHAYDHDKLEAAVGPVAAWLLINTLCKHGVEIIEYGTSPRFGWLTDQGVALKAFLASKSDEELYELCAARSEDDTPCYPDCCNCGPNGYEEGRRCPNAFWKSKP